MSMPKLNAPAEIHWRRSNMNTRDPILMKYVEVLKDCRSLNAAAEMNCPMPRSVEKVPVRNEKRCRVEQSTADSPDELREHVDVEPHSAHTPDVVVGQQPVHHGGQQPERVLLLVRHQQHQTRDVVDALKHQMINMWTDRTQEYLVGGICRP